MAVFLPLNGPNTLGKKPKAPSLNGWQAINYRGINPKQYTGWFGLRMDGYICVDCDGHAAAQAWLKIIGRKSGPWLERDGWIRRTPHGLHFIYRWYDPLDEHPELQGPHAGVLPGIDLRQGRTSQIVYSGGCGRSECGCDGTYETINGGPNTAVEFRMPEWSNTFVLRTTLSGDTETWDEMPEGVGNNTMTALAGTMRKQGMSLPTMVRCLAAINKITMTTDPMPKAMIVEIARSVSRYAVDPFVTEIEFEDD